MPSARVRLGVAAALIVLGALGVAAPVRAETSTAKVVRLDLDQAVQPIAASYVVDGIHAAEQTGASAVLLRIDTPGGLDRSMRQIVGAILGSRVPVVCWVGPNGARAASAGTFILLACHIATMAPGTNVGAAHPVGLRGEVLADKITNDAAAFIRSIAQERGRNVAWAERAVRGSVSASDREALRLDVIDAVVGDTDAALRFTDGRTVDVAGKEKLAQTWPAHVERDPIAFLRGLLGSLVDPNLAFLLLLVGLAGIVMEVLHPGLSIPGVVGLLSLVLALVMLEMLPVRPAGVILILAGAALIVAELYIPGGVAGAAGVACLVLGGLFLYDAGALVRVSRPLLVAVVVVKALFAFVVVRGVLRTRRMPPPLPRTLVGAEGVATTDIDPVGTVRVRSELWTATAGEARIEAGSAVQVVGEEGLRLRVDRLPADRIRGGST